MGWGSFLAKKMFHISSFQVYDFFASDLIGQNFLLITASQVKDQKLHYISHLLFVLHSIMLLEKVLGTKSFFSCSSTLWVMSQATSFGRYLGFCNDHWKIECCCNRFTAMNILIQMLSRLYACCSDGLEI